jgi:hypothetical protein
MLANVIIADDRPSWIRKEDELAVCQVRCSHFKKCVTRCGTECKMFGGNVIPKINFRRGQMEQFKRIEYGKLNGCYQ